MIVDTFFEMPPKNTRIGSQSKGPERDSDKEVWKCKVCRKGFENASDKIVQCEYCNDYYCSKCLGLSASEYQNFKTPALHWYCPSCEEKVMKNLRTDREVEKRCSEFMQKMEGRIKTLEIKIESKVNSEEVVEIVKCIVDESEKTNTHANSNTEVIEETVNKKVSEIRESTMREKNIIIHGVNEIDSSEPSVRKQNDTKFVTNLAEFLDNDETCIKSVVRIGKKKTSNKVDVPDDLLNGDEILIDGESESSVHTKPRPMKVTFTNTDVKKSFMKQLSKLKDVDESSPFKNISISHDMTKNERDQNKAMFEETKRLNTEEKSGKHRHIVRGPPWARKIIRVVAKIK